MKIQVDQFTIDTGVFDMHKFEHVGEATITSSLKRQCDCSAFDCKCADSPAQFNAAVDAIESMILYHYFAGVDVQDMDYVLGVQRSLIGIAHLDS